MREFQNLETALVLDACKGCRVVWFDAREFEQARERGRDSAKRFQPCSVGGRRIGERSASDEALTAEVLKSLATFFCLPF